MAIISQINKSKIKSAHSCHDIAVAVLRVQGPSQDVEKTDKIIKTKAESWYISDCSWWDNGWSHDQFANTIKNKKTKL